MTDEMDGMGWDEMTGGGMGWDGVGCDDWDVFWILFSRHRSESLIYYVPCAGAGILLLQVLPCACVARAWR